MGIVTVITSGKGGAGKSTVTAGLGCALARSGRRVLLIDADAGLRSLDLLLGIGDQAVYDLSDIFEGNCVPIQAVYASPVCPGVSVLPAPVSVDRLCSSRDLVRLCKGFSQHFDHVLIDCAAGVGKGFACAVESAQRALVVATPDRVCARDANLVGRLLAQRQISARLLINRLRPGPIMAGLMPDVDDIIDMAGLRLLGIIPEDESVAVASANGQALPVLCHASRCFANVARRFEGEEVPLAPLEKMR